MAIHLSFRFFTMVRRSSCTPIASWILLQTMVFVGNVPKSPIASHLKGLDPSFDFCCQGSALTCIKEGGKMSVRIRLTLEASKMFLSLHMIFSPE